MGDRPCVVCTLALDSIERDGDRDAFQVHCQRCGSYIVHGSYFPGGIDATPQERAALSAALRAADRHGAPATINSKWRQLASAYLDWTVPQKMRAVLEYVGTESKGTPGSQVYIRDELDYPLFAARSPAEYHWLRRALHEQGLLDG